MSREVDCRGVLGKPFVEMDCMDAARWLHMQLGRAFPPTAIPTNGEEWNDLAREIEGAEDPRWKRLGGSAHKAERLGDIVVQYAPSLDKFHVSTLADERNRLFLTSLYGQGVRLVPPQLCSQHVLGVYRSLDLHPEETP